LRRANQYRNRHLGDPVARMQANLGGNDKKLVLVRRLKPPPEDLPATQKE
jgi:hypothetical protein